MKKIIKFTKTLLLALLVITYSCSNDDDAPIINLEDLEVAIDENPTNGQVIGIIQSNSTGSLTFSIASQTPNGAVTINENTGELTVADATLFDFETNPTITATVEADKAQNTASVTINVNNINELSVQDFTAVIDENPTNGDAIGTVQATDVGTLSYSIASQTPTGALTIDASTGGLSVANASLFDFETNPSITATISVDNSSNVQTLTATINLNNVNELSVQDFTATINENPTNGDSIGTVQATGDAILTYSITSQTPAGALNIDTSTGALSVINASLFDFETNPTITATISVDNSGNVQTLTATINLNNVNDLSVQDFTATTNENPTSGDSIGTVQATGDATLTYSITSQTPAGALNIDANTGELSVADANLFDFEVNPIITATIQVNNSGNSETLSATIDLNDVHEIGEFKFGGVIFWVNATNDEGLVCALTDLGFVKWGCPTISAGASGTDIGTGESNTQQIITACTIPGIAADLATNLNLNGYNDWFLPSKSELNEMYINKQIINTTSIANGGANLTSIYWSSSEINMTNAWVQSFVNGTQIDSYDKDFTFGVRVVRAWTD